MKEIQLQDLHKDYEHRIRKKDEEINELKHKIEEMSTEFANMLRVIIIKKEKLKIKNVSNNKLGYFR